MSPRLLTPFDVVIHEGDHQPMRSVLVLLAAFVAALAFASASFGRSPTTYRIDHVTAGDTVVLGTAGRCASSRSTRPRSTSASRATGGRHRQRLSDSSRRERECGSYPDRDRSRRSVRSLAPVHNPHA